LTFVNVVSNTMLALVTYFHNSPLGTTLVCVVTINHMLAKIKTGTVPIPNAIKPNSQVNTLPLIGDKVNRIWQDD